MDTVQPLWLKMPNDFDHAYQVYANGSYVGQFGLCSSNHVRMYYSESVSFPLPPAGPDGESDLAVRFYMVAATPCVAPDVGGMHQPPVLGLSSTVHLIEADENETHLRLYIGTVLEDLLFLLVAPLALWVWLKSRQERAYLWLSLALTCFALGGFLAMLGNLTLALPFALSTLCLSVILESRWLPMWVMSWWHWFGLRDKRWIPLSAWLLTAARMLALACEQSSYLGLAEAPLNWLHRFDTLMKPNQSILSFAANLAARIAAPYETTVTNLALRLGLREPIASPQPRLDALDGATESLDWISSQ